MTARTYRPTVGAPLVPSVEAAKTVSTLVSEYRRTEAWAGSGDRPVREFVRRGLFVTWLVGEGRLNEGEEPRR